jgi:hypothetical protein
MLEVPSKREVSAASISLDLMARFSAEPLPQTGIPNRDDVLSGTYICNAGRCRYGMFTFSTLSL